MVVMNKKVTLYTEEFIFNLLKRAGAIKDRIEPICNKKLRWLGKKLGYKMCVKCYPDELYTGDILSDCKKCKRVIQSLRENSCGPCYSLYYSYIDISKVTCEEHKILKK